MATLDQITCLVTDCDGVLTDGTLFIGATGELVKPFHVHDGSGIKMLQESGIQVCLTSGRESPPLQKRAEEMDIEAFYPGMAEKKEALVRIQNQEGYAFSEMCYAGDDLTDMKALQKAGVAAAPADARKEVRRVADVVMDQKGGRGAFRELAERILKAQDLWHDVVNRYSS